MDKDKSKNGDFIGDVSIFESQYNESIKQHINENAYTDRKLSGSLVGTVLGGSIGFAAFSGAVSFGLGGCKTIIIVIIIIGAIGVLVGGILGSRIKKKIDLHKLSIDQLHCF